MKFINHTAIKVQHSMIIGCGGKGSEAVVNCWDLVQQELFSGSPNSLYNFSPLQFVLIDSTKQDVESSGREHPLDTIAIASDNIETVIDDPDFPAAGPGPLRIGRNMPMDRNYRRVMNALPSFTMGNSTCPPIGAINFLASWPSIRENLKGKMENWRRPVDNSIEITDFLKDQKQIFIVASLYGGTGSGVHIHVAAMLRDLLAELEIENTAIYGIFFLPDIVQDADRSGKRMLRANTYACLKELDYFLSGNPYILKTGQGEVKVGNSGTDFLFNKVFLINDRNTEGIQLDTQEAPAMVGELLFHSVATSMGAFINQRIMDEPNTSCQQWAPEEENESFPDKRITAYSTFGLATTRIPYDLLRNNLIVDFAVEIMNDILLLPDDHSEDEIKKVQLTKKELKDKFIKGDKALNDIELSKQKLEMAFKTKRPDFMVSRRPYQEKVEEYMDRCGVKNLDEAFERIRSEINTKVMNVGASSDTDDNVFIKKIEKNLEELKDKVVDKGGTTLCQEVFFDKLHSSVNKMKDEYDSLLEAGDPRRKIERQLKSIQSHLEQQKGGLFKRGKRFRWFNSQFKNLKKLVDSSSRYLKAARISPVLEVIDRFFELMKGKISEEKKRFSQVTEFIKQKTQPYQSSTLLLNPVPEDLLNKFIQDFRYPAGVTPEDVARDLKENGLHIGQKTIPVSDFPEHPEEVSEAIFRLAAEKIDSLGKDRWKLPFTESGLYPMEVTALSGGRSDIKVDAYRDTARTLVRDSAPYLEYQQGEKFDTFHAILLIHPDQDMEKLKWKGQPWPEGRKHFLEGQADASPYSLTCLQFHFGLPLYSIDEIEEWKTDYEHILKTDDRPLHKFDLPMKEPYINVTGVASLTQTDIKECLDWALEVSKKDYPIFLNDNPPILDALENNSIKQIYFELFDDVYLELDRIGELLRKNQGLAQCLEQVIKPLFYQLNTCPIEQYLELSRVSNKVPVLIDLLKKLGKSSPSGHTGLRFRNSDGTLKVFIQPSIARDNSLHNLLKLHFLKPLQKPKLKDGIDKDYILAELNRSTSFRECFFNKCIEACNELRRNGQLESEWPSALRES